MEIRLQKNAVLKAIGSSLNAFPEAEKLLRNRLMLLTRLGFPAGVNTGRGFRGGYDIDQFWKTILAFQVLQMAVPLSRTIQIVEESWDIAHSAIAYSLPGQGLDGMTFHWLVEPAGFPDFPLDRKADGRGNWHRPIETIGIDDGAGVLGTPQLNEVKKYSVINASMVVDDALEALSHPELSIDQHELMDSLLDWAKRPSADLKAAFLKDRDHG